MNNDIYQAWFDAIIEQGEKTYLKYGPELHPGAPTDFPLAPYLYNVETHDESPHILTVAATPNVSANFFGLVAVTICAASEFGEKPEGESGFSLALSQQTSAYPIPKLGDTLRESAAMFVASIPRAVDALNENTGIKYGLSGISVKCVPTIVALSVTTSEAWQDLWEEVESSIINELAPVVRDANADPEDHSRRKRVMDSMLDMIGGERIAARLVE